MRTVAMLPLALAAVVLAGCAAESPSNQETASAGTDETVLPDRDLTLQSPAAPVVAVASPVELSRPVPRVMPTRHIVSRRPVNAAAKPAPAAAPVRHVAPAPAVEAPVPAPAEVVPVEDVAVGAGRELAPGTTVTVVPASSGPSYAPEAEDSWLPEGPARGIMVGGGDTCRRRGGARGIGIGGRIPIGVHRHRLR
jgi:hypothetical protein